VGEEQAEAYCRSVNGRLPSLDEWLLAARGPSPRRFSWGDQPPARCDQHPFAAQLVSNLHMGDPRALEGCPAVDAGQDKPTPDTRAAGNETPDAPLDNDLGKAGVGKVDLSKVELGKVDPSKVDPAKLGRLNASKRGLGKRELSANDIAVGKHSTGASPSGVEDVLLTPGELLRGEEKGQFVPCSRAGGHCVVFGMDPGAIDGVQSFYKVPTDKAAAVARVVTGRAYGFRCVVSASEVSK